MKSIIKKILKESLIMDSIETLLDEDYPSSFNMEEFKQLSSFRTRIKYCEENLKRISSGSSRIVYMIDNEKVLKLAKNKKGLAQNEVEAEYSNYYDIEDVVARVFDVDPNDLWVEMELARKVTPSIFQKVTGMKWRDFQIVMQNHYANSVNQKAPKFKIDAEVSESVWDNEFGYDMLNFMASYALPVGDLIRISSYGLVKRDGGDDIVMIDYGLTSNVYDNYYS